ncbi:DUF5602 domain-containing protein [Chloroflexi bacterium TSY]|nr:DUF5602 domain-containing protein [Chloroflexi bacterium TSY]
MFRRLSSKLLMIGTLLVVGLVTMPVFAVSSASVSYGDPVTMGNGSIRTFVKSAGNGKPLEVGVEFGGIALSGLPTAVSDGKWDVLDSGGNVVWPCCGHEHLLFFPDTGQNHPFQHAVINWNPVGHPPPAIYGLPHFDFHFYIISNATRTSIEAPTAETVCSPDPMLIPLTCEDFETATAPLSPQQRPPLFMSVGAVEPAMGNHLINPTAREFNGEPFTETWIFGTWDGAISFFEPMLTLDFLKDLNGTDCVRISMPQAFAEAGNYPTRYCMKYQKGQDLYTITLDKFRWFDAATD